MLFAIAVAIGACVVPIAVALRFTILRRGLPWRLRAAELAYAERVFVGSMDGVQLSARVDRAYWLPGGDLVLAELKTRREQVVYLSDVIELSVQRVALTASTGERTQDRGYLVLQSDRTGRRRWLRFRLLRSEELLHLARRRQALLEGSGRPNLPTNHGLCGHCRYRRLCAGP